MLQGIKDQSVFPSEQYSISKIRRNISFHIYIWTLFQINGSHHNNMKKEMKTTDRQILQKHHKFIREDEDNQVNLRPNNQEYGEVIAKKYYDKLYKQFAIVDLSQYQEGKIGCRWRTEKEVLAGKGETTCGAKRCEQKGIQTYQINFGYFEDGQKKNALVKIRTCSSCGLKLNFKKSHVKLQQ